MLGKIIFHSLFVLIISFTPAFSLGEIREELFLKIGIRPVKTASEAPNFSLKDLNGEKFDLKRLKGKVVFLNFWATWCRPCKEEMPSIEALYQQFKEKDFVFLTISVDYEGRESVKKFIEKKRYSFPVLLDPKCEILDLYRVKGIPATIVIDKNMKMIGRAIGPRSWNSQDVVSLVLLLISAK
ncbi:MAG: TlpA family protein disulfide reductase [Syntrophaceae bacterium]|nr:TlpA family protein disulfide reductase [Syntrophaceae bacterium]